jgi:hypothetical protein
MAHSHLDIYRLLLFSTPPPLDLAGQSFLSHAVNFNLFTNFTTETLGLLIYFKDSSTAVQLSDYTIYHGGHRLYKIWIDLFSKLC